MDGTTVKTHTEAADAEAAYTQQTVDVTRLRRRRQPHAVVQLPQRRGRCVDDNMTVDDVSIQLTPPPDTTAPNTTITSSPAGGIAKSLTVPIAFTSNETPSTFNCKVDTGAAAPCTSPKSITVTPGQHTFSVAATDAALNTDATPATVTFTAYDCPTLDAAVTAAQAKATAAAKKVARPRRR